MRLKPNPSIQFKIIYEDKDVIVIDKPAGLLVHPLNFGQNDALANGLIAYWPPVKNVGGNPLRPGIVHRLDKDTSGLMIIAKNNSTFEYLKKQFHNRKIIKKYLALVIGRIKDNRGTITKAISLSKKDHRKRSALFDEKAKLALTKYQVIKRLQDYTLLEVYPKTGRTHQIRVHLASIGHPIAGDRQYKFKRQAVPKGLSRQFLHAFYLKFQLPDGKMVEFNSALPKELKDTLSKIESMT